MDLATYTQPGGGGLSQAKLAKLADITPSTICRAARGDRMLSERVARKLIEAMALAYANGETQMLPLRLEDLPVKQRRKAA